MPHWALLSDGSIPETVTKQVVVLYMHHWALLSDIYL